VRTRPPFSGPDQTARVPHPAACAATGRGDRCGGLRIGIVVWYSCPRTIVVSEALAPFPEAGRMPALPATSARTVAHAVGTPAGARIAGPSVKAGDASLASGSLSLLQREGPALTFVRSGPLGVRSAWPRASGGRAG
jgi:hypothetical protein